MKDKIKLVNIKPLRTGKKKYIAVFEILKSGKKTKKTIKFGAKGMSDFTIHKVIERRNRYIKRHTKDLRTNNPIRAGYLSMYILWNKKTFNASLKDYKRRLNIYNKTGKFPKSIPNSSLKNNFFGAKLPHPKFNQETYYDGLPDDIKEKINREVSLKELQSYIRKYFKSEQFLEKIYNSLDDYERHSGGYDEITEKHVYILQKANEILTKDNLYDIKWYRMIQYFVIILTNVYDNLKDEDGNILPEIKDDNGNFRDEVFENEFKNFEACEKELIKLLKELGYDTKLKNKKEYTKISIELQINEPVNNQFGINKVPKNVNNPKLYMKIKSKIKKDIKNRRWGAYDSKRLVSEYIKAGGTYSGNKKKNSNLTRWFKEKWIDACKWPKKVSCGRTKASSKTKVTYCRPSKIIDSKTPITVQELTKKEIKDRCSRKKSNPKKIIR